MEKGWNFEYFAYKKYQLEEKLKTINNPRKRKELEQDIEMYNYLTTILLFSSGKVICEESTLEEFVETMYKQEFLYKIPQKELKKINDATSSLTKLPKLNIEQFKTYIDSDESIEIVGDFIKDKFNNKHYQLYKTTVMSNYTLFDEQEDISSVTYLDNEIFLRISKTDDIKMLSSLAHEVGHIYRILNNDNKIVDNSYKEYESFFYEFNLLLWLIKNNIYAKDATNYFLHLFNTMENILLTRSFITEYQLNKINDSVKYRETMDKFHLKKQLNIEKDEDFFDIYATAIEIDLLTYFNSFMAVIDNVDDFNKYEQIIKNIKSGNDDEIRVKLLNKNRNKYNSYLNYRNFLQNQK